MIRQPTEQPVKRQRRVRQTVPLEERLAQQARNDRDHARKLPPGRERDELLRHARHAESASCMAEGLLPRTGRLENNCSKITAAMCSGRGAHAPIAKARFSVDAD